MNRRPSGSRAPCVLALCVGALLPAAARSQERVDPRVIAVAPFRNVSGSADEDWIGRGIAETLAAMLEGVGARVVPVEASADAAVAAARSRGASWVVAGGYQRLADRLRITGRLIDASDERVVHSAIVDGLVTELFALQDRLGADLGRALGAGAGTTEATDERGSPARRPVLTEREPPLASPTPRASGTAPGAGVGFRAPLRAVDGPAPPAAPATLARDATGRATVRSVRLTGPWRLDGVLDEPIYAEVPPIDGFIQQLPEAGVPPTEETDAWVFHDENNLYVAARLWDSEPDGLIANEMQRDSFQLVNNDFFSVGLDTFYDRRNGVTFLVNAIGGFMDFAITDEDNPNMDWNAIWDVRTGRFDGGWTVEMEVPFKSLRFPAGVADVGPAPRPQRPPQVRDLLSDPGADQCLPGADAPLRGGHADRGRGAGGEPCLRGQAVRDRFGGDRRQRRAARHQRGRRQRRARRQVRRDPEPDCRLHLQHRLRPGGGGRAAGEPDALQPLLPREAGLLPRGAGHLRLRATGRGPAAPRRPAPDRAARRRLSRQRRRADRLLQPPHRARAGRRRDQPDGADHRWRADDGEGRALQHRGPQHPDRRRRRRGCASHELHGAPGQARHPAAQPRRGHLHRALRVGRGHRLQRGLRARCGVLLLRQRALQRLLRPHPDARARRRRCQLPGGVQLRRRPLRLPARPPAGRRQLQSRGRLPAPGRFPPHLRAGPVQPPAGLAPRGAAVHLGGGARLHRERRRRRRDAAPAGALRHGTREQRPLRRRPAGQPRAAGGFLPHRARRHDSGRALRLPGRLPVVLDGGAAPGGGHLVAPARQLLQRRPHRGRLLAGADRDHAALLPGAQRVGQSDHTARRWRSRRRW